MRLHCIFITCLSLFALCSLANNRNAQGPGKCCFSLYNMRIPLKLIVGYETTLSACPNKGIIFIMEDGKEICANPNERWVQRLKKRVDIRILKEMTEVSSGDST